MVGYSRLARPPPSSQSSRPPSQPECPRRRRRAVRSSCSTTSSRAPVSRPNLIINSHWDNKLQEKANQWPTTATRSLDSCHPTVATRTSSARRAVRSRKAWRSRSRHSHRVTFHPTPLSSCSSNCAASSHRTPTSITVSWPAPSKAMESSMAVAYQRAKAPAHSLTSSR